jgi:hypothetical protein
MEDFNLVLKELISKDLNIDVPDSMKIQFDKTADNYVKTGNLLDAIKVFTLTRNKTKLMETANLCLKENKPYEAYYGFYAANDPENLNKVGYILLKIPDVSMALRAFRQANNQEMILFLSENFAKEIR